MLLKNFFKTTNKIILKPLYFYFNMYKLLIYDN